MDNCYARSTLMTLYRKRAESSIFTSVENGIATNTCIASMEYEYSIIHSKVFLKNRL